MSASDNSASSAPRKYNRKYDRYNVFNHTSLRGSLVVGGTQKKERMVSFGQGGAGFIGFDQYLSLTKGRRVVVKLEMPNLFAKPLEVSGQVIYADEMMSNNRQVIFYGVEFDEADREQLSVITQALDRDSTPKW